MEHEKILNPRIIEIRKKIEKLQDEISKIQQQELEAHKVAEEIKEKFLAMYSGTKSFKQSVSEAAFSILLNYKIEKIC